MSEIVIALLMIVNNEITEHRIQPSMGECLKGKRHALRQYQPNVRYVCIKSQAELETNILSDTQNGHLPLTTWVLISIPSPNFPFPYLGIFSPILSFISYDFRCKEL